MENLSRKTISSYRDLIVWQKSRVIVKNIYRITSKFPKEESFGITLQLRRAAVSIPSNIAEGQRRGSRPDYKRFLSNSFGSVAELETQLLISCDLGYITQKETDVLISQAAEISRMLYALINKLS